MPYHPTNWIRDFTWITKLVENFLNKVVYYYPNLENHNLGFATANKTFLIIVTIKNYLLYILSMILIFAFEK